jgi:hypothetical protein
VTVSRMAYRAPGRGNLHPADALNLPVELHSHGLRKLAASEAPRGSFQDATDGIERACGQQLAKRQVEELAQIAAVDFEDFYEKRRAAQLLSDHMLPSPSMAMPPSEFSPPPAYTSERVHALGAKLR